MGKIYVMASKKDSLVNELKKKNDRLSISPKNDYICSELGEISRLSKEGILSSCL